MAGPLLEGPATQPRDGPPTFAVDAVGCVVAWNHAAARLFGWSPAQALGRRCWELIRGRDLFGNRFCHSSCAVRCMLSRGEVVSVFELRAEGPRLSPRILRFGVFPFGPTRQGAVGFVHTVEPVDGARRPGALVVLSPRPRGDGLPNTKNGGLTPREREILGWVAAGLQNKEIARLAGISLSTVRNHVHNLLEKLSLHSKLEAVSLAFRNGWVHEREKGAGAGDRSPSRRSERKAAPRARS